MDHERASALLSAERAQVQEQIADLETSSGQDRPGEGEARDFSDVAQPLEAEAVDEAVLASLRLRLAALERASQRLVDETYGRSIRSGVPIPDERLEADPAAELTIEEAQDES